MTTSFKKPTWWSNDHDSAWDRVKSAMQRDWDQTKHHFGGDEPDTKQNVVDTVKQASGADAVPPRGVPVFEEAEGALKYGYAARKYYGEKHKEWDDQLEANLRSEWEAESPAAANWDKYRKIVRRGWDYNDTDKTK